MTTSSRADDAPLVYVTYTQPGISRVPAVDNPKRKKR